MLIKSVEVTNFRCAKEGKLNCGRLTAMVGANGAGKSTFLRALNAFYDASPKLEKKDWYNEDLGNPIEIGVTYVDLSKTERERFASYIDGDELTVVRVIEFTDNKIQSKYFGSRMSIHEFKAARNASRAPEFKEAYKSLKDSGAFEGLPACTTKDEGLAALDAWETAHPYRCKRSRDEGQFFGFKEVGLGRLSEYTRHIYVPAVRDAGIDADEGKDSPVKEIVDLVVRNSLAAHKSILELKAETKKKYEQIVDPKNLSGLSKLQDQLSETLSAYVAGAKVLLDWLPTRDIQLDLPKTDVALFEDGYKCSVNRAGHGLQRAFILTMLQHLAITEPPEEAEKEAEKTSPDLVLCIEEPEVYQHPSRQRHFAALLHKLARGTIEGVARKTQVLYSTHSPMFVGLDRFDQIRVLRKEMYDPEKPKKTRISESTLTDVARKLWSICGNGRPEFTAESLLPRLQTIMTPWMNEGFFAKLVVLVEGEDDAAAVRGTADHRALDLDALDIAVIPCGGKNNLDRPALIFKMLDIPTYVIWDSDKNLPPEKAMPKTNRNLLKLFGANEEDFPHKIEATYACFGDKLETTLNDELGHVTVATAVSEIVAEFHGVHEQDCLKRPMLFTKLLEKAALKGHFCKSLNLVLDKIFELSLIHQA